MKSIRQTCKPRKEVLEGDLQDAIFAADFGHVVEGIAPGVYKEAKVFFQNTYPTKDLKKIVMMIFDRLASPDESGATIRLSTGFGGGKTHTLIALWHLANNIGKITLGTELLPAAGRPKKVKVAAIDAGKFGATVCATHGDLKTHSLWAELAFQLGGKTGYNKLKADDNPASQPEAKLVREMLPEDPVLILLDELVIYMATLDGKAQKALLAFINMLIAEVGARTQAIVVITDPAGQPVYEKEATQLADATKQVQAAQQLDDVLSRKLSHFDPIGDEAAQVISRRLFQSVAPSAADEASAQYYQTYQRISENHPGTLPLEVSTGEYSQKIVESYPFHPRLLETAQERLSAMQDFNLSRGTMRLFARIIRDIWDEKTDLTLISAGDIDWSSDSIQADLLNRLNRDNFKAAVDADVIRHAYQLDMESATDIHRRVASALLLESLPLTPTSAMDKRDITLATLRPEEVGHEPGDALDRLMSVCWHTYITESGTKFQFRFEPNVIKLIEERAETIPLEDAKQAVMALVQKYFGGHTFALRPWPDHPQSVRDEARIKLVLCDTEKLAEAVCAYEDDSDPEAKKPRRFRNALLAIAPSQDVFDKAFKEMRRYLAAEEIYKEQKKKNQLKEQIDKLRPSYRKRTALNAYRAFNRVVFQGRQTKTLDEKYLVNEENVLSPVSGQAQLKDFLDNNKLVYQPKDAIDVDLLLELIRGATPSLEYKGAYPASSVHERALASERLRLMMNEDPVRNGIFKGIKEGKLVIRQTNGDCYDNKGYVHGPDSRRERSIGTLATLALNADVFIAPVGAPCVNDWFEVDEAITDEELISVNIAAEQKITTEQKIRDAIDAGQIRAVSEKGETYVVVDDRYQAWEPAGRPIVSASSWEQAITYASNRSLLELCFRTEDPTAAKSLIACAQPFGAKTLTLSVTTTGVLNDGGTVNFAVTNVKHNTPLKPIDMAEKLLRATTEGSSFEAELELDFAGEEQFGAANKFEQSRSMVSENIHLVAKFGSETTANGK